MTTVLEKFESSVLSCISEQTCFLVNF